MTGESRAQIFVALSTFAERDRSPRDRLERSGFSFELNELGRRLREEELVERARRATVVIAGLERYGPGVVDRLPDLRCIVRCGVGVDTVDLDAARARGIAVLNTPDSPTDAVAELALTMILALSRRVHQHTDLLRQRRWVRLESGLLSGRIVGLIGLGRIGRRIAEMLAPIGPRLAAYDPNADIVWAQARGIEILPLDHLLRQSQVISVQAAPVGPVRAILGRSELAMLPNGAVIVNVARGGLVDETALLAAIREGRIAGAGLDVYAEEPYVGPLCDEPNVLLTPHAATHTVETRAAMEAECVDKAVRFLRAEVRPSEWVVPPEA